MSRARWWKVATRALGVATFVVASAAVGALSPGATPPAVAQEAAADDGTPQERVSERPATDLRATGIDLSFASCEAAEDDAALQAELARRARESMGVAAASVDYRALVLESWRDIGFDAKFERLVDAKIAEMRTDRSYLERLLDGNIPSRAQDMATRTAALVFESAEFDALQRELGDAIGARLEPVVARADADLRTAAARCVQSYLDQRYATLVSGAFASEVGDASFELGADVDAATSATLNLAGVLAAIMIVVFRRVARRVVASIVRRLAGAIAARLAAWVSVVLGAAFLVYELVAGADGVFPVIRKELLSEETRVEIQDGVVASLSEVGPEELERRAQSIAVSIFARWRAFKDAHRAMLDLADEEPRFRRFLEDQPRDRFDDLTAVVADLLATGGSPSVMSALDRGVLARAMRTPGIGRHLEAWSPRGVGLEALLAWADLAGPDFERALQIGLPGLAAPESFTADSLAHAMALDDRRATRLAALLDAAARRDYLALPRSTALSLSARLEPAAAGRLLALARLARTDTARRDLIERGVETPALASALRDADIAIARSSASPWRAAEILLDPSPAWNPMTLTTHVSAIASGEVSPFLLWSRYGWWSALLYGPPALLAFWALRFFVRLVRPRRSPAGAAR